jgi:hypothetical protein
VAEMKESGVPTYTDDEGEHIDYPAWAKKLGITVQLLRVKLRQMGGYRP